MSVIIRNYYLHQRLAAVTVEALHKIPVKILMIEDREVQGDDECCAICIEPYEVSETLRSLPCRHNFHKNCIDPWLLKHHTCPMCNMNIVKYYRQPSTVRQERILLEEVQEAHSRALSPAPNPPLTSDNSHEEADRESSSRAAPPDELVPPLARTSVSPGHVSRSNTSSPSGSRQEEEEAASSSTAQDSAGVTREP